MSPAIARKQDDGTMLGVIIPEYRLSRKGGSATFKEVKRTLFAPFIVLNKSQDQTFFDEAWRRQARAIVHHMDRTAGRLGSNPVHWTTNGVGRFIQDITESMTNGLLETLGLNLYGVTEERPRSRFSQSMSVQDYELFEAFLREREPSH